MMVVEEMAIVLPMAEAPWDLCCRPGPAVSIPGPRPIDLAGRAGARRSARRTRLGAEGALNSRWEPLPETAGPRLGWMPTFPALGGGGVGPFGSTCPLLDLREDLA